MLGAAPVRPIDLAAFYAAIANEGTRPLPYLVEEIDRDGEPIYRHHAEHVPITSVDHAAFYQLKSMLQGVLARGTARSIAHLAPYVAGKTGTSDSENDAWFVGFTNYVTVAVWVGYDNADGKRRTLGGGSTGGGVAVPIFEPIIQAVWATDVAPKTALAPPSAEARRQLTCQSVDLDSGEVHRRGGIAECFRIDRRGKIIDTQYRLLSHESAYAKHQRDDDDDDDRRARLRRRQRDDSDETPARARSGSREGGSQRYGQREWRPAPPGEVFFWGR